MSNLYTETEPRFTTYPEIKIYLGGQQDLHVVCDSEHHTCYFSTDIKPTEVEKMVRTLMDCGNNWDMIIEGLRIFSWADPKSCLMGDMKQGSVYEDMSLDGFDRWKDGMKWDDWVSEEQVAQEFYAYQERKRKKENG